MGNNTDISGYVGLGVGILATGAVLNMLKNIHKPHPKDYKKPKKKRGFIL